MNGDEGFTKAKEFIPDLITLDILMPKQSGIHLYRKLREDEELKNIPIIVLTGVSKYNKFLEMDFSNIEKPESYIEKPIIPEDVIGKVNELIK